MVEEVLLCGLEQTCNEFVSKTVIMVWIQLGLGSAWSGFQFGFLCNGV